MPRPKTISRARRLGFALLVLAFAGACKKSNAPTSFTTAASAGITRVIVLTGSLTFDDVAVGDSKVLTFTIRNDGNTSMVVSGLSASTELLAVMTPSWTSGTLATGASQDVSITFKPTAAQSYSGTIQVNSDRTSGTNSIAASGRGVAPAGSFGGGSYFVGRDLQAGRYFSAPTGSCYWERQSGSGNTATGLIGNNIAPRAGLQAIVDILPTDFAFAVQSTCGFWTSAPRLGAQTTINSGEWLVGSQVAPGTYRGQPELTGCYWERRRDFQGTTDGIITNDIVYGVETFTTIVATDVGFVSEGCGTWTLVTGTTVQQTLTDQSPSAIAKRAQARQASSTPRR